LTTTTVQPDGTAGIDTKVNSTQPTRNYGITGSLLSSTVDRMLLRMSLSAIPATDICDSAVLSLFQVGSSAALAFTLTAYKILLANGDWIEGTKNNATAGTGEPCWDYKEYNTVGWAGSAGLSTSGTDYDATALGTVSGNRSDANGTEYQITLPAALVETWFGSDTDNYGLLIVTSAGCGNMGSSDYATAGYRPKLVVNHHAAGVTVTPAAVSAVSTTINPTTVLGSVSITPNPAGSVSGVVTPTVVQGAVTIANKIAEAIASIVNPTVVKGSLSLTPDPVGGVSSTILGGVIQGAITIANKLAEAFGAIVNPTVAITGGNVSVTPDPANAVTSVLGPDVDIPLGRGRLRRILLRYIRRM